MISLHKLDPPQVLVDNAAAWTATVMEKLAKGEEPTKAERSRYNHPAIKAQLLAETSGKCAYCESKMRHVSPGDIEHVAPKSVEPAKWFEWTNLTVACNECNRRKSNKMGPFVDPYAVDPTQHVVFYGPFLWSANDSPQGTYTEITLELNRAELFERRVERFKALLRHLALVSAVADPLVRDALRADFNRELTDDREFAAMARTLATEKTAAGDL